MQYWVKGTNKLLCLGEKLMIKRNRILLILVLVVFSVIFIAGLFYENIKNYYNEFKEYPLKIGSESSSTSTFYYNKAGNYFCLAILYISNTSSHTLTLENVALLESENIEVIETSLMKIGEERALLGFVHWPLDDQKLFPYFDERIPAQDAIIEPGQGYNLLFVVKLLADEASAAGQKFIYKDERGRIYRDKCYHGYAFNNNGMPTIQESRQHATQ